MKYIILITFIALGLKLTGQNSFSLPGNDKWFQIAKVGGRHAYIEYKYSHSTAYHPSISTGKILFINSESYTVQVQRTMGYSNWNQLQFAIINYGNTTELWVKATPGVSSGSFVITDYEGAVLVLGDVSDNDLQDNGGSLKIYDKLADDAHVFISRRLLIPEGRVGIGTSSPQEKLHVAGTIRAEEIKVEAQTADFVFDEDYNLLDLNEVERFIKENKHLPDIPSATEMEESGVNLAEMNKLLLQKIEELTLYVIEKNKEVEELANKYEDERAERQTLTGRLTIVEKILTREIKH